MSTRSERVLVEVALWASWGLVIALYVFWPLTHLDVYGWSNDEGLYVQRAALANAGYPLYTEILLNKPPLLVWILQLAFRVAGQTLVVGRLTALALTLLGLVALGAVAGQLWGRWAGMTSAAVWVGLPEVPLRAHVIMSDLPALAFALVSLGAACAFRRRGHRIWLLMSSAAFAAALLIHPLLIYFGLPLIAVLFLPIPGWAGGRSTRTKVWPDLAVFVAVGTALGLVVLAAVDWRAFLTWVFRYNYRTASVLRPTDLSTNWGLITDYLDHRWPLVVMAGLGAVTLCTKPAQRRSLAVAAIWLLATVAVLLAWSPLWMHYRLFVALPLVVVAGSGLAELGRWGISRHEWERSLHWLLAGVSVLTFGAGICFTTGQWRENLPHLTLDRSWSHDRLMARAFLRRASAPSDLIVTDDPLSAFAAGRLVPPTLTEASYRHIYLGYLATGDLVESTLRYRAPIVLFATGRLDELPDFEPWVRAISEDGPRVFGTLRAYELHLSDRVRRPVSTRLGDAITLEAYTVSSEEVQAGDVLTTTLFWRCKGQVSENYHVFVHLVDARDHMAGQHDGLPLLGAYPTSEWTQDLLLPDPHTLVIDPGTPPGHYKLVAGMYRWPTIERLPAYRDDGDRWRDDLVILADIDVVAPDRVVHPGVP
jgi:hypothetical protein